MESVFYTIIIIISFLLVLLFLSVLKTFISLLISITEYFNLKNKLLQNQLNMNETNN